MEMVTTVTKTMEIFDHTIGDGGGVGKLLPNELVTAINKVLAVLVILTLKRLQMINWVQV